jgi:hypothetical protein
MKPHAGMDVLKEERAKIIADCDKKLAAEEARFWEYQIVHRKKLHELRAKLEQSMNDIGARCLPYPEKGSSINEIMMWFTKEIDALPDVITKANKIFLVYCLVGVLKMLQELGQCFHVVGLEAVMGAWDAFIFDEVPGYILKISAQIVTKWWSSYGLPCVAEAFRIAPEVRFFLIMSVLVCCKRKMRMKSNLLSRLAVKLGQVLQREHQRVSSVGMRVSAWVLKVKLTRCELSGHVKFVLGSFL